MKKIALGIVSIAFALVGCSQMTVLRTEEMRNVGTDVQVAVLSNLDSAMHKLRADNKNLRKRVASLKAELLAQVGELLLKEQRFTITIEGHTDARGTEDYNFTLGAKRAMKVKEFLNAYGIEGKRMESVSYGKEAPKAQGETEEAYSQNRRANFRVNIQQ